VVIFPFVSLALYGVPDVLAPRFGEILLRVMVFLLLPTIISVGMAWYAARRIYGLRSDLSRARELGSYHLVEKLGEGGMGEVWKAEHRMLARPAAIKLIHPDAVKEEAESGATPGRHLARFEREVQATAQLRSPHTIEVYDYGLTGSGTFYYVMELLDGLDLQEVVTRFGPMPPERVTAILLQACHSLAEAHGNGLVHRDIKPANIFLCRLGRDVDFVKVLDFGLVKRTKTQDAHLTQVGTFAGTPAYAPPEMAGVGVDEVDGRADIYSLGCVAYWLLAGRVVFSANTALQMLLKHSTEIPKPPSEYTLAPLPEELDQIILDCLAKDPDDRVPSIEILANRLRQLQWSQQWTDEMALAWWQEHLPTTAAPATA
jgi:serine/threonine-protein kinase